MESFWYYAIWDKSVLITRILEYPLILSLMLHVVPFTICRAESAAGTSCLACH
jgi:hypothetical protein